MGDHFTVFIEFLHFIILWSIRQDAEVSDDAVKGVPAAMGVVEGPVCVVTQDKDLKKVQKGDIIVT